MERIEELVYELNGLCREYIMEKERFRGRERMKEIIAEVKALGYDIVTPALELASPGYDVLSEEGKALYDRRTEVRRQKMEAVEQQQFERAADLRDLELRLGEQIREDFDRGAGDRSFIFAGKISGMVLLNDPGNVLVALFK